MSSPVPHLIQKLFFYFHNSFVYRSPDMLSAEGANFEPHLTEFDGNLHATDY